MAEKLDRGDGLTDAEELTPFDTTSKWNAMETDPFDNDTDGDGLDDNRELGAKVETVERGERITYYRPTSITTDPDTDDDSLLDGTEVNGWAVEVVYRNSPGAVWDTDEPYRWNTTRPLGPNETNGTERFQSEPDMPDSDGDGISDSVEKEQLHTDPDAGVTYGVTVHHQHAILENSQLRPSALGLELTALEDGQLNDSTDAFDFVLADDGSVTFTALDGTERTDTWLSNQQELAYLRTHTGYLDPWDPDTDDDGLTDGQERKWVTETVTVSRPGAPGQVRERDGIRRDSTVPSGGLNPTSPDSDGDGYWDGWIGVYSAGDNSRNVILYEEHLRDEDMGIQPTEVVPEQAGVHRVEAPSRRKLVAHDRAADIDGDGFAEHSNVYLGELHWGTEPTDASSHAYEQTQLDVEVDYIEGHDPFAISKNGVGVLTAVERNYRIYGFEVTFHKDDKLGIAELKRKCKSSSRDHVNVVCNQAPDLHPAPKITPDGLNRHETEKIEDYYHDDERTMHLLWGTEFERDSPKTAVDIALDQQNFNYGAVDGMTFTNGAPGTEQWSTVSDNDFGVVIGDKGLSGFDGTQSLLLHELGHALGAGYADDDVIGAYGVGIENGLEAYSGDVNGRFIGTDETPELPTKNGDPRWSIMMRGTAVNQGTVTTPRFAFSIEELSTMDFRHIPSRSER